MKDHQTKAVRVARDEPFLSRRRLRAYVVCALITFGLSLGGSKVMAGSISDLTPHEAQLFNLTNQARAANGLAQLRVAAGATDVARNWTRYMANSGSFRHNPNYMAELIAYGRADSHEAHRRGTPARRVTSASTRPDVGP